jgi:hypothetical protein
MKVTTSWAHRRRFLSYYGVRDFDTPWEYFVYLHVNSHVQRLHLGGTLVAIPMFPWAMYELFTRWSVWPTLVFTLFYYGSGFISHYTGDGQVSQTWRQILLTYAYAVRMNLRVLSGRFPREVQALLEKYPEIGWIYFAEAPAPSESEREAWLTSRARPAAQGPGRTRSPKAS